MPDNNVALPDGSVVAFPDSMADTDIAAAIQKHLGAPSQPQASFGQRFGETTGLSGLANAGALDPAKQALATAAAPANSLMDVLEAHKKGDTDGVISGLSKLIDSFIPGSGNANQVSQNTVKDVQQHNTAAVAGTATGLAAQLAMALSGAKAGELSSTAKSALIDATGQPKPIARLILGSDRARALGEIANPEVADARVAARAKAEALSAGRTAPGPWTPGGAIKAANAPAVTPAPSLFGDATSSAAPGGSAQLPQASGVPQGSPTPFVSKFTPPDAGTPVSSLSGAPDDLITRTQKLVVPGETPTVADLKRAGDLTQAPLSRLQQLAKFGDRLAQNEINRRLKNP